MNKCDGYDKKSLFWGEKQDGRMLLPGVEKTAFWLIFRLFKKAMTIVDSFDLEHLAFIILPLEKVYERSGGGQEFSLLFYSPLKGEVRHPTSSNRS